MRRLLLAITLTLPIAVSIVHAAPAETGQRSGSAATSSTPDEASAQSRRARAPRARTRILVQPRAYPRRNISTPYPPPYTYDSPGPNAVRDCVASYVQEARPSGTVIVPRVACRWIPG